MRVSLLRLLIGGLFICVTTAKRSTSLLDLAKLFASPDDVARVQAALSVGTATVKYAAAADRSSVSPLQQRHVRDMVGQSASDAAPAERGPTGLQNVVGDSTIAVAADGSIDRSKQPSGEQR